MQFAFARTVEFVPTFNGNREASEADRIKVKLRSLELGDFFDVVDALSGIADEKGEVNLELVEKKGISTMRPLLELGTRILPKYCEVSGVLDDAGVPVTPLDIARAPFFLGLTAELLGQLASISTPKTDDVKN